MTMSAMMNCLNVLSLPVLLLLECSSYGAAETQCESGVLLSDNCYGKDQSCFNKEKTAQFSLCFRKQLAVSIGFIYLDMWNGKNTRVTIDPTLRPVYVPGASPVRVKTEGLSVIFHCWAESKCLRAAISWMACGQV